MFSGLWFDRGCAGWSGRVKSFLVCVVRTGLLSAALLCAPPAVGGAVGQVVSDSSTCVVCGDFDGDGLVTVSDLSQLSSYLFGVGPAPSNQECIDIDGYLLPTLKDCIFLADYLFGGGVPPVCPPTLPPCAPLPGPGYTLRYDPAYPPHRITDTLVLTFSNLAGTRGLLLPLVIRVGGAIPVIGTVQTFNTGGWTGSSHLVNPAGAPPGSVLLAFQSSFGLLPPGDRVIARIEISLPATASTRAITLDLGTPFPPNVSAQEVNSAVAIGDDPGLACWDVNVLPEPVTAVDCGFSYADWRVLACPAGDEPFTVYLRDAANQPVVGSADVWLDFSGCASVTPCPSETDWPLVLPTAPSGADGRALFLVNAGGCDDGCLVEVHSSCGLIATVPFKAFDTDGNLAVSPQDFDGSLCSDWDASNDIRDFDFALFTPHISHSCAIDARKLIRPQITVSPDVALKAGDSVRVKVEIHNYTSAKVTVDSVVIHQSGFDLDGVTSRLPVQPAALDSDVNSGDATEVSVSYVVPPLSGAAAAAEASPLECLTAEVYTSASVAPSEAEYCQLVVRPVCTPDTAFQFRYYVPVIPVYYWPWIFMPTGFTADVDPNVHLQFTQPDSVDAWVSIDPPTATIGDSGRIFMLFCEDVNCFQEVTQRIFRAIYLHQRGDVNDDCAITSADVIHLVNYIFRSGAEPLPYPEIGNIDCLGAVTAGDIVTLVNFIFRAGPPLLGDCP